MDSYKKVFNQLEDLIDIYDMYDEVGLKLEGNKLHVFIDSVGTFDLIIDSESVNFFTPLTGKITVKEWEKQYN